MKYGNRSIFIILISVLFIFSCDDYCEITDYESYLPLVIGNKWRYDNNEKHEIVGKKDILGDIYYTFQIEYDVPGASRSSHFEYYRFFGSNLYRVFNNNKFLIADFSLKKGDVFVMENTGFDVIVESDDPNRFTFTYNHPDWADEEYTLTFSRGVGIISECSPAWGWCTELTDYEVN